MIASLSNHAEFFVFAALCVAAFGAQGFWLRQARSAQLPWRVWTIAAALLAVTWHLAAQAGDRERQHIQKFTQDFARLYGGEMEKRGHWKLASDAGPDDPLYLDLIETEKRWLALSPSVNDIYTLRKLPDGRNVFIVDSETDYDRNGKYEGEREQRTTIGEIYEVSVGALENAFRGKETFAFEPITDRWGTWVSAFVPMLAPDGRVDGVLGVDFEAKAFTHAIVAAEWRVIGLMAVMQIVLLAASTLTSAMSVEARERQRAAEQLAEANRRLLDVSRQAGMAEVATSVLHNVGNVLNSANVSVELATSKVRQLKSAGLGKAAALLHEHSGDLPAFFANAQGALFPGFLSRLSEHFSTQQAAVLGELTSLRANLEHINEIVAMQQSYASCGGVIETIKVAELIEDGLRMNAESLAKHAVTVTREFAAVPDVSVDKHKLLQILVNLIRNGMQSCEEAAPPDKRLTLRVANGNGSVKISVVDNGLGIPPENLDRIFRHGFTTKKTGHGFGLHSGALAAKEMGGALRVESAGCGLGATFTVELPLSRVEASPASLQNA